MIILTLALAAAQAAPGATLLDRTRTDRVPSRARLTRQPVGKSAAAVVADAPDVTITGVRFHGVDAPAPVARAAAPFLGRKAARQTLAELAAALAAAYRDSDVALYTVAIPAQDFARGLVVVQLIEGRIAGVDFAAPAGPQLRARLTPLTAETPLSRATFERQLTLARAIPGLTLDADVADPAGTGALRLQATPRQKRRKLTAGYTSRGVDLLGAGQLDLNALAYGALIDGDQLSAGFAAAPDLRRFRLATAGYTAPVGSRGTALSLSGAYLETRPRRLGGKGTAKQLAAAVTHPLLRRFTRSADLSVAIDGIDSDDATIASVIARERARAARVAVSYAAASERRSWSVAAAASHGLAILDAFSPDAERGFAKLTASANLSQAIGRRVTARVSASGQYSGDRVPATERFAIGGDAIGRAFDEAVLAGDRGGGGLAELAWRPVGGKRFGQSELYAFADAGRVRIAARDGFAAQRYSLASAGAGGRLRFTEKAELGVEAARVVDRPYPAYRGDWQLTASWRLTL